MRAANGTVRRTDTTDAARGGRIVFTRHGMGLHT